MGAGSIASAGALDVLEHVGQQLNEIQGDLDRASDSSDGPLCNPGDLQVY